MRGETGRTNCFGAESLKTCKLFGTIIAFSFSQTILLLFFESRFCMHGTVQVVGKIIINSYFSAQQKQHLAISGQHFES